MIIWLLAALFALVVYVVGVMASNGNMATARIQLWRNGLTLFLAVFCLVMVVQGKFYVVVPCVILLPLVRNLLDPARGRVTAETRAEIDVAMTRGEALRILELDEEEASVQAVEEAFMRLIKLVHPDKGGTSYFAAKLTAARDFMRKNPSGD